MSTSTPGFARRHGGAIAIVLALLAPPAVVVAKWFLLPGILGGSLAACFPAAPWLKYVALVVMLVVLAAQLYFIVRAISDLQQRALGFVALTLTVVTAPITFVVLFLMTFGDPGPGGPYCAF